MIFVFNSTPLIYLCRASLSWIFNELVEECFIPREVYIEVIVKGKEEGKADALVVQSLVEEDIIKVRQTDTEQIGKFSQELHSGEIGVLALAQELNATAIMDDDIAKAYGAILGVEIHGTIYLLLLLVKRKKLTKDLAKEKLKLMIENGFWLSSKVYSRIVELIETL